MQTFKIRNDFPAEFLEEFAKLAVAFGRTEYMIKLCLKSLGGHGFTAGMAHAESKRQFAALCEAAKTEAHARLPAAKAASFCNLIDQAKALGDYRNDTIHALWTTDKNGTPLRIRPKWNKASKSVDWSRGGTVTIDELKTSRRQIEKMFRDLDKERKTWKAIKP